MTNTRISLATFTMIITTTEIDEPSDFYINCSGTYTLVNHNGGLVIVGGEEGHLICVIMGEKMISIATFCKKKTSLKENYHPQPPGHLYNYEYGKWHMKLSCPQNGQVINNS